MLENYDPVTSEQLKDYAIRASQQKEKFATREILSTELKFNKMLQQTIQEPISGTRFVI